MSKNKRNNKPNITEQILKKLYFNILYIRLVELKISEKYNEHNMRCPTHLAVGQEAIASGISQNLNNFDIVFSTHRSHAHYLAKGGDLNSFISELYGKSTGCASGFGGSQHLLDKSVNFWGSTPIVASTIPVAVGAAFSVWRKQEKRIVVVYFGDAATEEGVFSESLNFAAIYKLPILFVCENNMYSTNTPLYLRQAENTKIYKKAIAYGVNSELIDGNDVIEVYDKGKKIIDDIRNGKGPRLIECSTYRTLQHCGPKDDPTGYRPSDEKKHWLKKDPLLNIESNLKNNFPNFIDLKNKYESEIKNTVQKAFEFAENSPFATAKLNDDLVYEK